MRRVRVGDRLDPAEPVPRAQAMSRAAQRSSITRPSAGPSTIPADWKNFNPLYCGGLCDAEICTPPAAPRSTTSRPRVGVAAAPATSTSRPVPRIAATTAASNTDAVTRASWPTTIGPTLRVEAYAAANSAATAGSNPSPTIPRMPDTLAIRVPVTPTTSQDQTTRPTEFGPPL